MSVNSLGASNNASSYLQSLLQQPSATDNSALDPMQQLLAAFDPSASTMQSTSAPSSATTSNVAGTSTTSGMSFPSLSPDTLASLISLQGQQWALNGSQGQPASNGDGQFSQSQFDSALGASANATAVGLANALDPNASGSINQSDPTSGTQQSQGHGHHHHHMHGAGQGQGQGQGGGLDALLSQTDLTGATTQTTANADGSSSTTVTYADGSTVTMTTPATSSTSSSSSGSSGSNSSDSSNLVERLIQLQSQMLSASASQTIATG